ncbi:Uncharacterised protein [Actinobaculum suis]|uniref:Uncharacterized protein n=1 Tax=Actinobaculum suis TaxID=1657 RepID=A0A0K9ES30_9ACTO|nr:hypothetical protein [Actinobaculum suis]KMY22695.1 hypothetical protein ACU19_08625 [Actinobaculum suis]VDG77140.1 Uncharacterised protein [Actinobaculum suis]
MERFETASAAMVRLMVAPREYIANDDSSIEQGIVLLFQAGEFDEQSGRAPFVFTLEITAVTEQWVGIATSQAQVTLSFQRDSDTREFDFAALRQSAASYAVPLLIPLTAQGLAGASAQMPHCDLDIMEMVESTDVRMAFSETTE